MIDVRPATLYDMDQVMILVQELARYEGAETEVTVTLDDYKIDFGHGLFDCHIAEENDQILGMVLYYTTYSTWKGKMLYLEDFIVKESERGRGIGRLLFKEFLSQAKILGCSLAKWQVLDWNTPAIEFYKKNKATIESEWYNGKIYSSDFENIIMSL